MQTWFLNPIDTLFFKEARPMEGGGTGELASVFPPPSRTLMGALRTYIGDSMGVDWKKFDQNMDENMIESKVKQIIGYSDHYANLKMQGVWIHYNNQRLFPVPLNIMENKQENRLSLLKIDTNNPYYCDLGKNVCLPINIKRTKSLTKYWLTEKGFNAVLAGTLPSNNDFIEKDDLYKNESRLGIAIHQQTRAVKEGMLYQTKHFRLKENISFSIDLTGDKDQLKSGLFKLGGEGRMVALEKSDQLASFPKPPTKVKKVKGICLYLLTPMLLPTDSKFLPAFKKHEEDNRTIWKGEIKGISLRLISSVIGKAHREGGWNATKQAPRAVQSFIPAGSVFYCEVDNIKKTLKQLNNCQIGEERYLGRGHIVAGLWT